MNANGHPQTLATGARPPAADLAALQAQLDAYDALYNNARPHQGIDGQTPDQRYTATAKAEPAPGRLPPPLRCTHVKVTGHGVVDLGDDLDTSIGAEWGHAHVDVIRDDLDVVIFHRDQVIRTLRIDPNRRYQPSGRPSGPKRPRLVSAKS